jgi:hypothetical protein
MRYMAFQSWDPRVGHGPLPRSGSSRRGGCRWAKRLGQLARLALGAQPAWTLDQSVALGALAHYACLPCKGRLPGPVSGEPDAPLRSVPQEVNAPRPDTEAVALYRRTGAEKVSPVIASVSSAGPRSPAPAPRPAGVEDDPAAMIYDAVLNHEVRTLDELVRCFGLVIGAARSAEGYAISTTIRFKWNNSDDAKRRGRSVRCVG